MSWGYHTLSYPLITLIHTLYTAPSTTQPWAPSTPLPTSFSITSSDYPLSRSSTLSTLLYQQHSCGHHRRLYRPHRKPAVLRGVLRRRAVLSYQLGKHRQPLLRHTSGETGRVRGHHPPILISSYPPRILEPYYPPLTLLSSHPRILDPQSCNLPYL